MNILFSTMLSLLLQIAPTSQPTTATSRPTSFTVAADGSGTHKTVQSAIDACPQLASRDEPFVIHIKPGTYKEIIYAQREKRQIKLVGDDPKTTIITYNLTANSVGLDGNKIGTFRTPTAQIDADEFGCENLTFENAAPPRTGQALAVRIDGDRVAFKNCRFLGYQDTIFGNRGRHYFEGCTIVGAVDFIFGGATEYYQNCTIHCIGGGYITASSAPEDQPYGLVFDHCHITAEPGVQTFLGRPWRAYSATAYLRCEMDDVIKAGAWDTWGKNSGRDKTARYEEYGNSGPGAKTENRAAWVKQLSEEEAASFEPSRVLRGWNPE